MHADLPDGLKCLIETTTEDLSSAAFRCICDQPLALFGRVEVVLKLPDGESPDAAGPAAIECDGIVVRQERVVDPSGTTGYLVAVFLDHTTSEQRAALDRLVVQQLSAGVHPASDAE